jgi:hypothetical protein
MDGALGDASCRLSVSSDITSSSVFSRWHTLTLSLQRIVLQRSRLQICSGGVCSSGAPSGACTVLYIRDEDLVIGTNYPRCYYVYAQLISKWKLLKFVIYM